MIFSPFYVAKLGNLRVLCVKAVALALLRQFLKEIVILSDAKNLLSPVLAFLSVIPLGNLLHPAAPESTTPAKRLI